MFRSLLNYSKHSVKQIKNCIYNDTYEESPPFIILLYENNRQQCFELVQFIAKGAYGRVYKYKDIHSNINIAVKFYLNLSNNNTKKELNNVNMISNLQDISKIFVNGKIVTNLLKPTFVILIMDYYEHTLESYIKNNFVNYNNRESKIHLIKLFVKLCSMFKLMYEYDIYYFDVKTSNVMILDDEPLLSDFGGVRNKLIKDTHPTYYPHTYTNIEQNQIIPENVYLGIFSILILQMLDIDVKSFFHYSYDTHQHKFILNFGYSTFYQLFDIEKLENKETIKKFFSVECNTTFYKLLNFFTTIHNNLVTNQTVIFNETC